MTTDGPTYGQVSWTARALALEGNPDDSDDHAEITSRWERWLDDEQRAAEEAGAAAVAATAIARHGATGELGRAMAENVRLRKVLERLADEDTWVLDEGLGGGHAEDRHVRAQLARQTLGLSLCDCGDCCVSLGIAPEEL